MLTVLALLGLIRFPQRLLLIPLALAFPLYHLTELARRSGLGIKETEPIARAAYLTLFLLLFAYLALKVMRKRLIR